LIAVHDLSLEGDAPPALTLSCWGPSGCGKVHGCLRHGSRDFGLPTGGRMLVDGEPVTGPAASGGVVFFRE
jgi:NitT/TauT family transport system ATP-binding protein